MQQTVDETIAGLRSTLKVANDAELARMLGVDKSTISSWRARGRVPDRFARMPETQGLNPLELANGGELHNRAHSLALLRFVLLRQDMVNGDQTDKALGMLRDLRPFWLLMHRAVAQLKLKMDAPGIDLATAQTILMLEDLNDPAAAKERIGKELEEDFADNPWLATYE